MKINFMLKILKIFILTVVLAVPLLGALKPSQAAGNVNLYFFYGDGCPHCAKEKIFLSKLERENQNVRINRYEVWGDKENAELLGQVAEALNIRVTGVPVTIVGNQAITGYFNDETTGQEILSLIEGYNFAARDVVAEVIRQRNEGAAAEEAEESGPKNEKLVGKTVKLPWFGEIELQNYSLFAITAVIGTIDGFNPCAMWTLLFLITLLLGTNDKRRMWLLGSAFIAVSGAVYFMFMAAWLNLFLFLGLIYWIRTMIGVVALGSGGYQIRKFWKNRNGGCDVVEAPQRKKIFERIKKIVQEQKFWLALGGIVLLAAAVNLVELVCSAGLPALYTQVLALSDLPVWKYYAHLALYIFFYMLDDMVIFAIAMATLQTTAISSKYARWSSLIGGIVILIIGVLLIFKPGWLAFS